MLAIVFTLVRFWMLISLMTGAALFIGLAIDRKAALDGRPVAPHLNLLAFLATISPFLVAHAMGAMRVAPATAAMMPRISVLAVAVGAMALAASIGRLTRRTTKRETPRPRWSRLDSAMGMLAAAAPLSLALVLIGAVTSPSAFRTALEVTAAIPPAAAIAAVYLSFATRPDRPDERVRRRDVLLAVAGGAFIALPQIASVVQNAAHGMLRQPLIPILMAVTAVVCALDEMRRRRGATAAT